MTNVFGVPLSAPTPPVPGPPARSWSLFASWQLVMNYLIVEGYRDAAENFFEESGTEPKVDLQTIEERVAIRQVHKVARG